MNQQEDVSRAGVKLEHALREFHVDVTGRVCADFGGNFGGFTDFLLQHGAAKVYAIDTGYGGRDYHLRTNDRGVVMERMDVLLVLRAEGHPPSKRVGLAGTLAEQRAAEALQRLLAQRPHLGV